MVNFAHYQKLKPRQDIDLCELLGSHRAP